MPRHSTRRSGACEQARGAPGGRTGTTVRFWPDGSILDELTFRAQTLLERLRAAGAHVYIPRQDLDYAFTVGLRMLTLRRLVEESDGLYRAREDELPLLAYYANSIAHLPGAAGGATPTPAAPSGA